MSDPYKIHDAIVKDVLSRKEDAVDFFRELLPGEITKNLDLENLEVENGVFVDEKLREYFSDMLFKVPTKEGKNQNLYLLFEHKSYPDKKIHLQLLKYMTEIHIKQTELMPILSIVFYHGKERWQTSIKFSEMFNLKSEDYKSQFLDFMYHLINLSQIEIDRLKMSLTLKFFLEILKYARRPDFEIELERIFAKAGEIFSSRTHIEFLHKVFLYIFQVTEVSKEKLGEIAGNVSKGAKKLVMTTAEKLRQEGIEEGIERGKLEGIEEGIEQGLERGIERGIEAEKLDIAKKMVAKGSDLGFVFEITGLTLEDLRREGIVK